MVRFFNPSGCSIPEAIFAAAAFGGTTSSLSSPRGCVGDSLVLSSFLASSASAPWEELLATASVVVKSMPDFKSLISSCILVSLSSEPSSPAYVFRRLLPRFFAAEARPETMLKNSCKSTSFGVPSREGFPSLSMSSGCSTPEAVLDAAAFFGGTTSSFGYWVGSNVCLSPCPPGCWGEESRALSSFLASFVITRTTTLWEKLPAAPSARGLRLSGGEAALAAPFLLPSAPWMIPPVRSLANLATSFDDLLCSTDGQGDLSGLDISFGGTPSSKYGLSMAPAPVSAFCPLSRLLSSLSALVPLPTRSPRSLRSPIFDGSRSFFMVRLKFNLLRCAFNPPAAGFASSSPEGEQGCGEGAGVRSNQGRAAPCALCPPPPLPPPLPSERCAGALRGRGSRSIADPSKLHTRRFY